MARQARPSKLRSVGLFFAVGATCAAGGYYAGANHGKIAETIAHLGAFGNSAIAPQPAKPAAEPHHADAIKPADKVDLARLATVAVEPRRLAPPPRKKDTKEEAPLGVSLLEKEFAESDPDGDSKKGKVTLSVAFENLAGKPVRAFEGILKFTDALDNKLYSSKIAVTKLISEGATLKWDEHLDASKLDDAGKRLLDTDKVNLRAVFLVNKVFFVDGTVKRYATRG